MTGTTPRVGRAGRASESGAGQQPMPAATALLLRTKLFAPPPRPDLVPRPRLEAALADGLRRKLTLIAAPAGAGKTTLLSAWRATATGDVPLAWVALDADDNDPTRFWCYVLAALDALQPGLGAPALALLQGPQVPIEVALTELLNGLAALSWDAVLVLDDYHTIDAPAIDQALSFLLDHLPPALHLVIASRADPPLPLARLRARGELVELRAAELRFTAEEASTFLTEVHALPLTRDDVAALGAQTEGWIAGLHLAALALRGQAAPERARFVAAFAGSNRFVADYLVAEVLERQPATVQRFLLETAVLDRLCAPLCAAVTRAREEGEAADGPGDARESQALLEELERTNLFLIPLDAERHWYRYHHLFAELLRHRLRQARPDVPPELHRRASAWFEAQGLGDEAVRHTLAARDWARAARLIERDTMAYVSRGQVRTVLGWLEALPDEVVRARPLLCLSHAGVLNLLSQFAAAGARLEQAERAIGPDTPPAQARIFRAWAAELRREAQYFTGDLAGSLALLGQAEALAEVDASYLSGAALHASRAYLLSGDVTDESERLVREALALVRASGTRHAAVTSLTNLARLQVLQGRLHDAAATYREAPLVAPGPGAFHALVGSASYYLGLGEVLGEWNNLDEAAHHLAQGLDLVRGALTVQADVATAGYITQARLQEVRGEHTAALATLEELARLAHQRQFHASLRDHAAAARARLHLVLGDLPAAVRWAEGSDLRDDDEPRYPRESEYLTLARIRIAQARSDPATHPLHDTVRLLERLLGAAEAGARPGSAIEILILRALALRVRGERAAAMAALERAVALAEPEGYCRVFADEGAPLAALLAQLRAGQGRADRGPLPRAIRDHTARLLAAFATPTRESAPPATARPQPEPVSPLIEPLNDRELAVLGLMAAGRSNPEIAAECFVAVSTVKWYINAIFGKLAVTSRTQAVARARELHLLTE